MTGHQAAALLRRWPEARSRLRVLGDFLASPPYAIEDPWGRDDEVFRACFARVESAIARLAELLARAEAATS